MSGRTALISNVVESFTDASGGRHDHYTLAIAHRQDGRYVIDVIRRAAPPFDPKEVTQQFAQLLKSYRITEVTGDAYGQEWVAQAWRECGVRYVKSEWPKSELYLEVLQLWTAGKVSIPDTHRSGRDTVDHGKSGSDDYVNSVCGVLRYLANYLGYDLDTLARAFSTSDDAKIKEQREWEYRQGLAAHIYNGTGFYPTR